MIIIPTLRCGPYHLICKDIKTLNNYDMLLDNIINSENFIWVISHRVNLISRKRVKKYYIASEYKKMLDDFIIFSCKELNPRIDYEFKNI